MRANLVLVVNCGSSSLKCAVFSPTDTDPRIRALAECIGTREARLTIKSGDAHTEIAMPHGQHADALEHFLAALRKNGLLEAIGAVGHRVVHGGETFKASTLITPAVLSDIEACSALAPLHNPANLAGIAGAMKALPDLPQIAVFDTAFHQTMEPEAYLYGLPRALYRDLGVRRYGFHGISHCYVASEAQRLLGLPHDDHCLIIAHLGNGASATAVRNGRVTDTTMGMTPLEGLIMGTRSGDVDFGALAHVARRRGMDVTELEHMLNRDSGLLGLSELSSDCRELEAAAAAGHDGARTALAVFAHSIARHVGGLAMSLPRVDALVFTGGIGENSVKVRSDVVSRLAALGLFEDKTANADVRNRGPRVIGRGPGGVVAVIPTNEERMIALDAFTLTGLAPRAVEAAKAMVQ
ncbi:acetate kinase [Breoghania sp. JC706]|uniref:acetate/propionate family kinase n=1 Tax=Breoghania sp. JC706 TaxID=3117732 RepID=UPI0030085BB2